MSCLEYPEDYRNFVTVWINTTTLGRVFGRSCPNPLEITVVMSGWDANATVYSCLQRYIQILSKCQKITNVKVFKYTQGTFSYAGMYRI